MKITISKLDYLETNLCALSENKIKRSNSFRIAVDTELRNVLYNPETWPTGVEISEYFFRRRRNWHKPLSTMDPFLQGIISDQDIMCYKNVKTMVNKLNMLDILLNKYNLDIFCCSEHWALVLEVCWYFT